MPAFVEEVLYEDAGILAVNKPAGLLAVPDRYDKRKENLFDLLQAARPGEYLGNVHRLDRHTSGVMIFAKNSETYRQLTEQFRERRTRKVYLAIAQGCPVVGGVFNPDRAKLRLEIAPTTEGRLVIDLPIGERPDRPGYSRIDGKHGKEARSTVRVLEPFRGFALLEVEIETGRQHQIRVHLQAIGCPLVGDPDYGGAPLLLSQLKPTYKAKEMERPLLARPALHAASVLLTVPALTITAPLPKDLGMVLKYLRKFAL